MFATVIVLVDAVVGDRGFAASIRAGQDYRIARARLAALQAENARLHEQMRRLTVDRRTIEALAREEMGFVRPGEVLFILERVSVNP